MRTAFRDLIFGLIVAAIAVAYHWQASHLPYSGLTDAVGAGGLPKILGGVLGGLGLLLALRSGLALLAARKAAAPLPPDAEGTFLERRGLALLAIGAGYVLIAPVIGYLPTIFLLLVAAAILAGATVSLRTVLTGAMMSLVLAVVFIWLIGTEQPEGPFGPLLRSWGI